MVRACMRVQDMGVQYFVAGACVSCGRGVSCCHINLHLANRRRVPILSSELLPKGNRQAQKGCSSQYNQAEEART